MVTTWVGTSTSANEHICVHCGHVGADVGLHYGYVGGQGTVGSYLCNDRDACWKRWEAKEKHKW